MAWYPTVSDGPPRPLALEAFERACQAVDDHAPFGEHTLLTLKGHASLPHVTQQVWDGEVLVGVAVLSEGLESWSVELATHPAYRGQGVGRALARGCQDHVASHGGGTVRAWVHGSAPAVQALAPLATVRRSLLVLRRDLDTALPEVEGVTRSLDAGTEAQAWLRLSNAAFGDHPENGHWTLADLAWRIAAPWSDSTRWPVLEGPGGLLAGVWTKVEPGSLDGELYVVAVDPAAQGRGLGRLVVAEALRQLRQAGCRTAHLYVDEANQSARALYQWAGFAFAGIHRCLELEVSRARAARTGGWLPGPDDLTLSLGSVDVRDDGT